VRLGGRTTDDPEFNLVPLIDVLFTLILFFVVTTTFDERSALKLELPRAAQQEQPVVNNPLVITIDGAGKFFVGGNEVLKKDVVAVRDAIAQAAGEDRTRAVTLRADAKTPHQAVVTALDALGQLGFAKISIATVAEPEP
jgi:biopolymer transport protein ExbD